MYILEYVVCVCCGCVCVCLSMWGRILQEYLRVVYLDGREEDVLHGGRQDPAALAGLAVQPDRRAVRRLLRPLQPPITC